MRRQAWERVPSHQQLRGHGPRPPAGMELGLGEDHLQHAFVEEKEQLAV